MRIITVSGTHSGVGKTTFIEALLKQLKGWSALKVTVSHNGSCPTHRNCGVCDNLEKKFCIVSDDKILGQPGKDTSRFRKAGAGEVLWLKAQPQGLREGLKKVLTKFNKQKGLIIEGTSVLKYLKPDLAILLKREGLPWKDSAKVVRKKIDLSINLRYN